MFAVRACARAHARASTCQRFACIHTCIFIFTYAYVVCARARVHLVHIVCGNAGVHVGVFGYVPPDTATANEK